ncbi:MAG: helix-turn-helix transcriptional regulator [Lachnospiraceae bacterium]|jgi:DNA-binding XRE family transcriptional regulator|nr:helix-turn-helix transcriptional regulator [Lachnospiraceae bacterium]
MSEIILDNIFKENLKNKEFAKEYNKAHEKTEAALALYFAREEAGLTQADLAERAGIPQSTVARIEQGSNVTFDKLAQLAHAMGKSLQVSIK